jgi:hypothetical protein
LALALAWPSAGCDGSGSSGGMAAPVSPEMKKKVADNLKDYPRRAAARAKVQRAAKLREQVKESN